MEENQNVNVKEIAYIALGVAVMIVSGAFVYMVARILPIPGLKYIIMSPFLSMVIYVLLIKIEGKNVLLKVGIVFGLIMTMMNLYMGLSIVITALLSQVSMVIFSHTKKAFYGAILFSAYTGLSALTISKYMIGGVFAQIPMLWIMVAALLCMVAGVIGTMMAKNVVQYIRIYSHS